MKSIEPLPQFRPPPAEWARHKKDVVDGQVKAALLSL